MKWFAQTQFNRFRAVTYVFILVTLLPFFVSQAAPVCTQVHSLSKPLTPVESKEKWVHLPTAEARIDHLIKKYTKGSPDFTEPRRFAQQILALPKDHQEAWLFAIGKSYRKIPKKDPNPLAARHVGGRRVLDYILTLVENYQSRFEIEIQEKGQTPLQVYRSFMNRQARLFDTTYTSQEIEMTISILQSFLKNIEKEKPGPALSISIAGSFPNGKADLLVSDIDLAVSDASLARYEKDLQTEINEAFQANGISSNLEIAFSGESTSFYGKINPIVIQVRSQDVQLMVFPPGSPRQNYEDLFPESPRIYKLQ